MNFVMSSGTLFINRQKASWYVSDGRQTLFIVQMSAKYDKKEL